MAKVKLYLDDRKVSKSGLYPVKIVVRSDGKTAQINTNIKVDSEQWDKDACKVVRHPCSAQFNKIIEAKMLQVQMGIASMGLDEVNVPAGEIVAMVQPDAVRRGVDKGLVRELFDVFVGNKEKESTRSCFNGTRSKVGTFCDWDKLRFRDITYQWLTEFDAFMRKQGNSVNTRSVHMRNVRALYNEAIRMGWIGQEGYPFRAFRIKSEETEKRSLSVDQLRMLRDYECEEFMRKYVDVFFISFYLAGINIIDLLNLPPIPKDGVIKYRRSKTGVLCQVSVPDEARVLIDKYKGKEHMLCFGEMYANHKDFLHRMNENLGKVGELYYTYSTTRNGARHKVKNYRALFPGLTSYWARHTWATIAADIDVPDAVIDAALGHKSMYRMTDIYVKRNAKKVDLAVRMVINYVNGE